MVVLFKIEENISPLKLANYKWFEVGFYAFLVDPMENLKNQRQSQLLSKFLTYR